MFGSIRGNLFAFMIGGLVVVAVVDIVIDGPLMSSMKMLFPKDQLREKCMLRD